MVAFDLVEFCTSAMALTKLELLDHWGYSKSEKSWRTHLLRKVGPVKSFALYMVCYKEQWYRGEADSSKTKLYSDNSL